jgi:O-antigen/teichoic acid export membrane protein
MTASSEAQGSASQAGLWSAIDIVVRQGLQFIVTVTLARLLAPAEFGLIALLGVFTAFSSVLFEGGPTLSLIRNRASTPVQESSVFWFNLLGGLLYGAVLVVLSPAIADFYGFPILIPLLAVAAAQVVIIAAGSVPSATLVRSLRFKTLLKVGLAASLSSGIVAVALAYSGYGVWALALQTLVSACVTTLLLWIVSAWRPTLRFSFSEARSSFRFGFHLVLSGFLDIFCSQGFALILAKLHGVRELGIYNRAQSTQVMPSGIISLIIGRVALPLLANFTDDPDRMRSGVRRALGAAMAINVPVMIGLAALSEPVILTLFGPAWRDSAPLLTIIAFAGLFLPIHVVNLQALLAQDRSREYLRVAIIKQSAAIVLVILGSFYGVLGLALIQPVQALIAAAVNATPTKRHLGYGLAAQLWDLRAVIGLGAIMGAFLVVGRALIDLGPLADTILLTALGAFLYIGLALFFRVEPIVDLVRVLTSAASGMRARRQAD